MPDKQRITQIKCFQHYEYAAIASYLSEMAEKGWMLNCVSGFNYTFTRTESQKLNFMVENYGSGKISWLKDPEPAVNHYLLSCAAAGWHPICSSLSLHFFYTENLSLKPVQTQPSVRLEQIHRRIFLPLLITCVALCLLVIMFVMPTITLEFLLLALTAAYSIIMLFDYIIWYRQSKQLINAGKNILYRTKAQHRWHVVMQVILFMTIGGIIPVISSTIGILNGSPSIPMIITTAALLICLGVLGGCSWLDWKTHRISVKRSRIHRVASILLSILILACYFIWRANLLIQ